MTIAVSVVLIRTFRHVSVAVAHHQDVSLPGIFLFLLLLSNILIFPMCLLSYSYLLFNKLLCYPQIVADYFTFDPPLEYPTPNTCPYWMLWLVQRVLIFRKPVVVISLTSHLLYVSELLQEQSQAELCQAQGTMEQVTTYKSIDVFSSMKRYSWMNTSWF